MGRDRQPDFCGNSVLLLVVPCCLRGFLRVELPASIRRSRYGGVDIMPGSIKHPLSFLDLDGSIVGVIVPRRLAKLLAAGMEAELNHREALLSEWDQLHCATSLTY